MAMTIKDPEGMDLEGDLMDLEKKEDLEDVVKVDLVGDLMVVLKEDREDVEEFKQLLF